MQTSRAGRPKSKEKREAILNAAKKLFLENGLKQTSMEEVAKHSGISKQTIYSHYKNKDALFSAVIQFKCEEYMIRFEDLATHETCLETALYQVATKFLALFHDEVVISMYTAIISEAKNATDDAKLFFEAGPEASVAALSKLLIGLSPQPLTHLSAHSLSIDFFTLLKGDFHTRSLMNLDFKLSDVEQEEYARSVVHKTLCLLEYHYKHQQ